MCILNEEDIEMLDKMEYELSQNKSLLRRLQFTICLKRRKPGQKGYGSPKSHEKVLEAMSNGVPEKTRNQIKWAVSACMEGMGS